jgi:hypothetical protein
MTERSNRKEQLVDALIADAKAQPRTPEAPLGGFTRTGRGGYLFVATTDEVAAMNPAVGPSTHEAYPHRYEPTFVAEIARCATSSDALPLERVAATADAALFMFPPPATDALARLTPDRLDFTKSRIDEIADQLMRSPNRPPKLQRGGASTAVLTLRGHCLEARTGQGREVYYWYWQQADAPP